MANQIFREYDIRGKADVDLTNDVVYSLGKAFGTYIKRNGTDEVVLGRDNRASSERLRHSLVEGLVSVGCRVVDIGLVVTPILYYARVLKGIDGGVMITGSHNPPDENGFKLAHGAGTIYGEAIQQLAAIITQGDFCTGQGSVANDNVIEDYLTMLKEKIKLGSRKLKVAIDCGNGTAALFAERVLQEWGCEVVPLFCDSDSTFPNHHPDPVITSNLLSLRETVLTSGCDLGVAFDGDADRLGIVDDQGNIVWGDRLMILYWREILPCYPGSPCIIEVKCSQALVEEVDRLGGRPFFYKTGHSLIKAKMKQMEAVFTGEMSGHMFFADEYFGFDDAFYATGRLLRILSNSDCSLSQLMSDVPQYYSTAETRVPCSDTSKFEIVARLVEYFKLDYQVIDVDGARVLFKDGWGLVRASNTQPAIVVRCEASTYEGLERIGVVLKEALRQYPEVHAFEWQY